MASHSGRNLSLQAYRDDLVCLRPSTKELKERGRAFQVARRRERPGPLPWRKSMQERIKLAQSLKPTLKGCPWGFAPSDSLRFRQLSHALKAISVGGGGVSDDSDGEDEPQKKPVSRKGVTKKTIVDTQKRDEDSFEGITERCRLALTKKFKKPPTKLQLQVAVKKEEQAWKVRKAKEEAAIGKLAHMSEEERAMVQDVVWQTKVTRQDFEFVFITYLLPAECRKMHFCLMKLSCY
jgi:hypothetical protein